METKFAYDSLPYSDSVFTQTHPDRLCSLARLFGLDAPDIENARVLELGCGNAMNIISQAYHLPNAKFVGIDLAKSHIDYAKNSAEELNLSNIEFYQKDLMDMSVDDFGKFDYIIAHGLISWIPDFVKEKTYSLFKELLNENGVGYISYNVYPGWSYRQMMRGITRIHTRNIDNPVQKIEAARNFVTMLRDNTAEGVYNSVISNELSEYYKYHTSVIYHDNLAEINEPYYFHEFAEKLEENDLQFVAESQLFTMSIYNYPPTPKEIINSQKDIVWQEQYKDFLTGRPFRQSIICHKKHSLNHTPEIDKFENFYVAGAISTVSEEPEIHTEKIEKFTGLKNQGAEINHPLTKAALYYLGQIWGNSILFSELFDEARKILEEKGVDYENWDEQIQIAKTIVSQIILNLELVEIHTYKTEVKDESIDKPLLNNFARWQLTKGQSILGKYERVIKANNPILKKLVTLLDGNHTEEDIYVKMKTFLETEQNIENKDEIFEHLEDDIKKHLDEFARSGMFV